MVPKKDFPYVRENAEGIRYNGAYPPDPRRYGNSYGGYANNARQVLLYDFAIQGYDVAFKYDGETYHLLYEPDHAALCDEFYSDEIETYSNPMELITNLRIKGHRLIDIIDDLKDVEPE